MTNDRLAMSREAKVFAAFVELADTLVADFDVVEMLTTLAARCVELLDAAAAGILLADSGGHLRVLASSSDEVELLELFQVQNDEGPCMDSYRTGTIVVTEDLATDPRWPQFAAESLAAGFPAVCAIPMRLRESTIGGLNLFIAEPRHLSDDDVRLGQALSDIACIAVFQQRAAENSAVREEQLQYALNSRVVIEQAKGIIGERGDVRMDEAFVRLRRYARNRNLRLSDVAAGVVAGTVDAVDVNSEP